MDLRRILFLEHFLSFGGWDSWNLQRLEFEFALVLLHQVNSQCSIVSLRNRKLFNQRKNSLGAERREAPPLKELAYQSLPIMEDLSKTVITKKILFRKSP